MIRRFARPYAKALMDAAGSQGRAVLGELMQFDAARRSAPQLEEIFVSPAVDASTKMEIVRKLAAKMQISALGLRILEVLTRNHRINDLDAVLEAWRELLNRAEGVAVAEVRTAHVLTPAEEQQLRQSLEKRLGRKVEVTLEVDPSLLGGFIATIGSEVWDASVVGRIQKFRNAIS